MNNFSEIRTTREGKRFMIVSYNNQLSNWGECLAEARNRHPGCGCLPVIAVSDTWRFSIGDVDTRKVASEPHATAPGRARNDDHTQGIHTGTPKPNSAENTPKSPHRWGRRWGSGGRPPNAGQQMSFNYQINNNNAAA